MESFLAPYKTVKNVYKDLQILEHSVEEIYDSIIKAMQDKPDYTFIKYFIKETFILKDPPEYLTLWNAGLERNIAYPIGEMIYTLKIIIERRN